jgi:CRISPR-associated Csx14 family protein
VANILIATLGESSVLITGLVDKLAAEHIATIDRVIVLCPQGRLIPFGYLMIEEEMKGLVEEWPLPFEDASTEETCFQFLREVVELFREKIKSEDSVFVSLAGGRKNMSALLALVVPFFPTIKNLYHLLDKYENTSRHNFRSLEEFYDMPESAMRKPFLHPKPDDLDLVDIPFLPAVQISEAFLQELSTLHADSLQQLWESNARKAEVAEFYGWTHQFKHDEKTLNHVLSVFVTEAVKKEYEAMRENDARRAKNFADCFEYMCFPTLLKGSTALHLMSRGRVNGRDLTYHYYKRAKTQERPFYHTEPGDIFSYPQGNIPVERVIIAGLTIEREYGKYDPSKDLQLKRALEDQKEIDAGRQRLYPIERLFPKDSILLVPMGESPMVATQLYVLFKERMGRKIQEVVLLYLAQSEALRTSAKLAKEVFDRERVKCTSVPIADMGDIRSKKDCERYLHALEEELRECKNKHPLWTIDLALSGGRKGMSAMAMFAAQKAGLRYVYHTLIIDESLERKVQRQTSLDTLNGELSRQERRRRMLLDAYSDSLDSFVLFKIPVVSAKEEEA